MIFFMKYIPVLVALLLSVSLLHAQQVYTIKADSVKMTNSSSAAELIIENHTQAVPGFLYNKGRGRTEFRRALVQLSDSSYSVGGDTIKILSSANYVKINPSIVQPGSYNIAGDGVVGGILKVNTSSIYANSSIGNLVIAETVNTSATGAFNYGIGKNTFGKLESGIRNTALGSGTLDSLTTGQDNTALGMGAESHLTTGSTNTGAGKQAQAALVSGSGNVGIGSSSQLNLLSSNYNTAIGTESQMTTTTEANSTYLGYRSGAYLKDPSGGNTAVGANSLKANNLMETYSVAVGMNAGSLPSYTGTGLTRTRNIYLGYGAGQDDTASYRLYIANSATNIALWGNMSTHHYIFNPAAVPVDAGYTLDIQTGSDGTGGTFRAMGLITASAGIKLTTTGSDTKWAIPIRDSATGNLVNIATGSSGQVLTILNNKPTWGYANTLASNVLTSSATSVAGAPEYGTYNLTATGSVTFTLPSIASSYVTNGTRNATFRFTVMVASGNSITVTVNPNSADSGKTINGASTATITGAYSSKEFWTDGTNWFAK